MTDIESPEPEKTAAISGLVAYERLVGMVTFNLKKGLALIESKFCYQRWEGLVVLLDLVETGVKDVQKIAPYLSQLMAKYKMQQHIMGLIVDGSASSKITPVTSKETSIALEILEKAQKLYSVNPHSKGFTVLIRLVVETASPQVQIPALRYIAALVEKSAAAVKSLRKSGGIESLGKWSREQRGAAKVISARPTLDVLEQGTRLIALLADNNPDDRLKLEAIFGAKELGELSRSLSSQKE